MNVGKKQFILSSIAAVFVIVSLEVVLRLASAHPQIDSLLAPPPLNEPNSSPRTSAPHTVPDDRLGYRPNPEYPGHDARGFRNRKELTRADVVALGDSQTYGTGVDSGDAWPGQLASLTSNVVYSMAYGGYGPVHSLILWDEAITMRPKMIIEAFYAGNDLHDSFHIVYNRGKHAELKSADVLLQESVQKAEQSEPIACRVSELLRGGTTNTSAKRKRLSSTRKLLSFREVFARHSKMYGLMRRLRYVLMQTRSMQNMTRQKPNTDHEEEWEDARAFAEAHSPYCQVFQDGAFKTIFTPDYRLLALDLRDPRIMEGHQISLRAILRMNDLARDESINFLTLLIPTKEFVFREQLIDPPVNYRTLMETEGQMWRITKEFLERNNIEYIDALPALRDLLVGGIQPYRVSADGHPNEQGHIAIAAILADRLQRQPQSRGIGENRERDRNETHPSRPIGR